jgi:hypothetical protein
MNVRSMLVKLRYVRIIHIRTMHIMVWNVRDMNEWAELLGLGIIWQDT